MQSTQAPFVCNLREVSEDRECEREVEPLIKRETLWQNRRHSKRRGDAMDATDLKDLLDRITAEQTTGSDVPQDVARQPTPSTPEVEHT
jgi:hypothetical protein